MSVRTSPPPQRPHVPYRQLLLERKPQHRIGPLVQRRNGPHVCTLQVPAAILNQAEMVCVHAYMFLGFEADEASVVGIDRD